MKQLIITSLFVMVGFSSCKIHKSTNDNPQKNLQTTITYAIKLLETDKLEIMLSKFTDPETAANLKDNKGGFKELAKKLKEDNRDAALLEIFKAIKNKIPEYNNDKTKASFKLEKKIDHKKEVKFEKYEGLWYFAK